MEFWDLGIWSEFVLGPEHEHVISARGFVFQFHFSTITSEVLSRKVEAERQGHTIVKEARLLVCGDYSFAALPRKRNGPGCCAVEGGRLPRRPSTTCKKTAASEKARYQSGMPSVEAERKHACTFTSRLPEGTAVQGRNSKALIWGSTQHH